MVRVRQFYTRGNNIVKHLSCNLCNELLIEATKIIPCFHTFCKECIYTKIREEELECCPVCDIYLGANPFTKMRPDFNLQHMRNNLFPVGKEEEARKYLPAVLMHASGIKPNMKARSNTSTSKHKNQKIKRDIVEVEENKVSSRLDPKENLPQAFFFDYDNLPSNYGVWTFKLSVYLNDDGYLSLPQITSCYAQMRDLSVSISYFYKFLSKEFDFVSENEIEIKCMGNHVLPSTTAEELVKYWLTINEANDGTTKDNRLKINLIYGRKIPSPSF